MGNCNTGKEEEEPDEISMKTVNNKPKGITVVTFSGPDAVHIEQNPEHNLSFSDPNFFSVRNSRKIDN